MELQGPLAEGLQRWHETQRSTEPEMLITFQNDMAALDVKEEKCNDPLEPLLSQRLAENEAARYLATRERFPFRVYKDRKWVATAGLKPIADAIIESAGMKNIVYKLR